MILYNKQVQRGHNISTHLDMRGHAHAPGNLGAKHVPQYNNVTMTTTPTGGDDGDGIPIYRYTRTVTVHSRPYLRTVLAVTAISAVFLMSHGVAGSEVEVTYAQATTDEVAEVVEKPVVKKTGGEVDTTMLIQMYFPEGQWDNAENIMYCESRMKTDAHGDKQLMFYDSANGEYIGDSIGLFQIRTGGVNPDGAVWNRAALAGMSADQFREKLKDPHYNVQYAVNLFNRYGWQPWSCSAD